MDFNSGPTKEMFVISTLSSIGSLSVVFSIFYFRKHLLDKPSMRVLLYMFISNLLTSLGSLMGYPENQSAECWFQGIVTNIFTLSSILWSVVITGMLYVMLVAKFQFEITPLTHAICWGLPVFATFIPFVNSTYGSEDPDWCWVIDTSFSDWAPLVWYWISYYLWIWSSFVAIVVLFIMMRRRYTQELPLEIQTRFKKAMRGLQGYPLIIFFCWLPATVSDFLDYYGVPISVTTGTPEDTFIVCCACAMGFLSSIYFWRTNDSVVELWGEKLEEVVGSSGGMSSLKHFRSDAPDSEDGFQSMNLAQVFFRRIVQRKVDGDSLDDENDGHRDRKTIPSRVQKNMAIEAKEWMRKIESDKDDEDNKAVDAVTKTKPTNRREPGHGMNDDAGMGDDVDGGCDGDADQNGYNTNGFMGLGLRIKYQQAAAFLGISSRLFGSRDNGSRKEEGVGNDGNNNKNKVYISAGGTSEDQVTV